MNTYTAVKNRLLELLEEKDLTIYRLATESAVPPSTIKNILYGKSQNPGIVTLKMLCDGMGISLTEFFGTDIFLSLEQEIVNCQVKCNRVNRNLAIQCSKNP